ncbi:hypothetical protein SAMN05445871_3952 [Paraburkholderia caballeronis]|uniref:Uncharacterized protein n=1 Tax=Paraburkholderia caballeronis TaxID=416943 RepID=A0A1H7L7T8_9BURK|nr:hypothetical protein C7403_102223 [Paraburkholderia caballeronis]PXX03697.1 hypothetical protein C7407_102223 [Paraburkholderia caballeronis]RAK04441.1 hypothetical protein C7409_102223 [Paraburkholderia caballeronis]SED80061.1 hypothetical protein SAMN05445871_3952 [Paraburkholderia caballeronis]SEK95008.1 hypothetical protein SAMN05192542_104223 [Paraburkholderia caballeronis]
MNVETTLETNAQFAETGKPGVGALDHPAMSPELLLAFYTATRDTGRDATLSQVTPTASKVITLVRMQFARALTGLAIQARHCWNRIDCGLERHRVVPVGAGDRDSQRNASCVYDDVPFRPELSPVRRVGAGFLAPRGLATLAASRLARSQSIWSCSRNRRSSARCSCSHTPAACQSRSRRQHVMPLPKRSSCGRSSHGMPVCSTYRMPSKAARSSTVRRRPPFGDGVNTGISGSRAAHNSLLIFRLAMPPGYGFLGLTSRLC